MTTVTVLIVSTEPIIGALLALYVEAHGYRAVLADDQQSPESEVARSGSSLILVDVDHRDGFSPAFIERQRAAGRRVIAFSPKYLAYEVRERAAPLQVPSFALPIESGQFRDLLDRTARTVPSSQSISGSARPESRR